MIALLGGVLSIWLCWFVLSALAAARCALDVLELEVDNLMDNNAADTTWPERVRRSVLNGIIGISVGSALVVLKLRGVLQGVRESLVLSIGTESWSELWLSEVTHLPVEFARHLTVLVHAREL